MFKRKFALDVHGLFLQAVLKTINSMHALSTVGPTRAAAPAAACVSGEDAAETLLGHMAI